MAFFGNLPMSNATTYRKEYYRKTVDRNCKSVEVPDYRNPISGPLEEHVLPYCKYNKLPQAIRADYPEPREYAQKVTEIYPSTRRILGDESGGLPDFDIVDTFYENENRTTYMVSYCKLNDFDSKRKRERTTGTLPEGWIIPLTTQRCSYRNPFDISPDVITKFVLARPKDNLMPNQKEREILQVKTGESIYNSDISNTGMEIINGKLHGDVNVRPRFDQDDLMKAKLIAKK